MCVCVCVTCVSETSSTFGDSNARWSLTLERPRREPRPAASGPVTHFGTCWPLSKCSLLIDFSSFWSNKQIKQLFWFFCTGVFELQCNKSKSSSLSFLFVFISLSVSQHRPGQGAPRLGPAATWSRSLLERRRERERESRLIVNVNLRSIFPLLIFKKCFPWTTFVFF